MVLFYLLILYSLFTLSFIVILLPTFINYLILLNNSNSLTWFSNLNLGTYLLVEKEPSPSINPINQNLVILILSFIELGTQLPDILCISLLKLIKSNLSTADKSFLSFFFITAFLNNSNWWYFELLRLILLNIGNITYNKEFISFTK